METPQAAERRDVRSPLKLSEARWPHAPGCYRHHFWAGGLLASLKGHLAVRGAGAMRGAAAGSPGPLGPPRRSLSLSVPPRGGARQVCHPFLTPQPQATAQHSSSLTGGDARGPGRSLHSSSAPLSVSCCVGASGLAALALRDLERKRSLLPLPESMRSSALNARSGLRKGAVQRENAERSAVPPTRLSQHSLSRRAQSRSPLSGERKV